MQTYMFIRNNRLFEKVEFRSLLFIEAQKNYTKVVTTTKTFTVLVTMKKFEEILPFHSFCRVHRSYIVSLENITAFDDYMVSMPGQEIPIGDQFRDELKQRVLIVHRDSPEFLLRQYGLTASRDHTS